MNFNLISPKGNPVAVEGSGIRERKPDELVHFLAHEEDYRCAVCGVHADEFGAVLVWTDRETIFDNHPKKCGERKRDERTH